MTGTLIYKRRKKKHYRKKVDVKAETETGGQPQPRSASDHQRPPEAKRKA